MAVSDATVGDTELCTQYRTERGNCSELFANHGNPLFDNAMFLLTCVIANFDVVLQGSLGYYSIRPVVPTVPHTGVPHGRYSAFGGSA